MGSLSKKYIYFDIIDRTSMEAYEIKPLNGTVDGEIQLLYYLMVYQTNSEDECCNEMDFGTSWPQGIGIAPWVMGGILRYQLTSPGLIEYDIFDMDTAEARAFEFGWAALKSMEYRKLLREYDYMPNISDADVYMMLPFITVLVGIAISYEATRAKSGGWL